MEVAAAPLFHIFLFCFLRMNDGIPEDVEHILK